MHAVILMASFVEAGVKVLGSEVTYKIYHRWQND